MQNNIKSSAVAGVLGVFLGAFGAHDWYLGNIKKAITHVCLCVGGIMVLMVGVILMNFLRDIPALNVLSFCVLIAAYVIIVGNGIWGFIEGVIILAQGDAGLAAKGYRVAAPITMNETMPAPNPSANIAATSDMNVNATAAPETMTAPAAPVVPVTDTNVAPEQPTVSATEPEVAESMAPATTPTENVTPAVAEPATTPTESVAPTATEPIASMSVDAVPTTVADPAASDATSAANAPATEPNQTSTPEAAAPSA